jgi:glycosyltransferase involved in cell wall biosynthesis
MKICYLADAANVHTQKWARFFVERGNDVWVISFRPANIPGVKVHHIRALLGKIGYLLTARQTSRLIHHISPDLLHAHHATSYGLIGALSGYHPYLISSWGSDVIWSPHQLFLFDWILRYNFKQADRITATSRMLARATAVFCPANTKVHVVPFGVDTDVFAPHSTHAYPDRPPTIGIVKTLRPRYGIRELILAFHQIADAFPDTRLVIVGGGEQYADLRAMVVNLGMETRITLTGHVSHEHIPEYLRSFDLFVVSSLTDRESFGVAAVEASATGLPVIASRVGGLPEVVLDGKTGLLVPPGDVDALTTAMSRLLADSALRAQMGQAGRQFVLENYRWEDNAELMEQLYNEVLNIRRI